MSSFALAAITAFIFSLKLSPVKSERVMSSVLEALSLATGPIPLFVVPIFPVTLHNWQMEHRFVLVTAHGGFNFYMGNHENSTGYPVQIGDFRGDAGSLLVDARREAE